MAFSASPGGEGQMLYGSSRNALLASLPKRRRSGHETLEGMLFKIKSLSVAPSFRITMSTLRYSLFAFNHEQSWGK